MSLPTSAPALVLAPVENAPTLAGGVSGQCRVQVRPPPIEIPVHPCAPDEIDEMYNGCVACQDQHWDDCFCLSCDEPPHCCTCERCDCVNCILYHKGDWDEVLPLPGVPTLSDRMAKQDCCNEIVDRQLLKEGRLLIIFPGYNVPLLPGFTLTHGADGKVFVERIA